MSNYQEILDFWFKSIEPSCWWKKDHDFDQLVSKKFGHIYIKAINCELYEWRVEPKGRLAEIIVLDQFSRNMFRDLPQSFSSDNLALALSQEAIRLGAEKELNQVERSFLYMPYMHSESKAIHEVALELYTKNGIQSNLEFEIKHKEIIDRFGRYPHRNVILDRVSTEAELDFLKESGSGF